MIGVVGSGTCDEKVKELAYEVGQGIAQAERTLVCGGLGGVMESACQGAQESGGTTIGILPGTSTDQANPFLTHAIVTGLGIARNVIIVRSAQVLIAIHGGPGTLSEVAYALQLGVPVVSLKSFDVSSDLIQVQTPAEAVDAAVTLLR